MGKRGMTFFRGNFFFFGGGGGVLQFLHKK